MRTYLPYLWYILRHKFYVFLECCKLGIPFLGIIHDLSKFLPSEFLPYAASFYGNHKTIEVFTAGSGTRFERGDKIEIRSIEFYVVQVRDGELVVSQEDIPGRFDVAWNHHQKHNKHHWQYWHLTQDDDPGKVLPMPDKYRREMLADWRGAGRAITGEDNTREWYTKRREKMEGNLHPKTREWIERQLGGFDD